MQPRRKSTIRVRKHEHKFTTRRAQPSDVDAIKRLVTDQTNRLFGSCDVEELIHLSYITLLLENHNKEIVAAICVNNYPNVPSIPQGSWKTWLFSKYRMEKPNSRNSLWVFLTVFENRYKTVFLKPLLRALYAKCPYINYICYVIPPKTYVLDWLDKHAQEIVPLGCHDAKAVQTLQVFLRHNYVVSYKSRKAVAEDNDDLVPLINTHSKRLKEYYGEFYIAEIVLDREKHEDRNIIVAEYEGSAVAVLCLNRRVNYKILSDAFQLVPFYSLRKPTRKDMIRIAISSVDTTVHKDGDSLASLYLVYKDHTRTLEVISKQHRPANFPLFDLNKAAEEVILIDEEPEEEEEEVEEEEEELAVFRGYPYPEISYDALEFTERQMDSWRRIRRRSISYTKEDEQNILFGDENAFTLEIAAAHPEHEAALNLLLQAAFELFPEREYCVLTMPSQTYSFPLISKVFVRVPPKAESDFAQELYLVHRSAISGNLYIREANLRDTELVRKFLVTITKGQSVMKEFTACSNSKNSSVITYLIYCEKQVIGLAILSDVEDLAYITSHYQLSTWTNMSVHKPGSHGIIRHFVLSPIFQRHARHLLLELHRLSEYTILFYIITPYDALVTSPKALAGVLGELIPVIPSKMPEYSEVSTSSWHLPESVGRVEKPYALYLSTPAYCGLTRHEINDRIIVVGASDAGIAFLVSLIFHNNPDIRVIFNNIILVSTHGIVSFRSNRFRDIMSPVTGDVSGYYLALLSLATFVTVVTGVMSSIDRKNKTILVNGSTLSYDMMFLMCGKQYQMPKRSEEKRGKTIERPGNVFIVNTEVDTDLVIKSLTSLAQTNATGYIVVYGYTLDAYCCLEAIMELGIPTSKIYFVQPSPTSDDPHSHDTIFNDADVEEAVNDNVKALGIEMYMGYSFTDWTFDSKNTNITSIRFESFTRVLDVHCLAVFMYDEKKISKSTFKAITNANLIFDGGLVIDTDCCTNDPSIYAAGTITKYSRRYYAEHMKQAYYNQQEIGEKLGLQILNKLMHGAYESHSQNTFSAYRCEKKSQVPRYTAPLIVYAKLPGGNNYMNVKKPGPEIPLHVAMTADDYGQVLTSGDCKNIETQGYFRLHLNYYNMVETITCFTKNELEKVNLTHLWGKHERLLNNLVKRFEMVTISDLFAFFSEPWTFAIYHDRFDKLNDDMTEILTMLTDDEKDSLMVDIIQYLTRYKWKKLTNQQLHEMQQRFVNSPYHKKITEKVLEFLIDNLNYLPMFANPTVVNVILAGYEVSHMFNEI